MRKILLCLLAMPSFVFAKVNIECPPKEMVIQHSHFNKANALPDHIWALVDTEPYFFNKDWWMTGFNFFLPNVEDDSDALDKGRRLYHRVTLTTPTVMDTWCVYAYSSKIGEAYAVLTFLKSEYDQHQPKL